MVGGQRVMQEGTVLAASSSSGMSRIAGAPRDFERAMG